MAKKSRAVRMESNPDEEHIVETIHDHVREPSARDQNLFDETRREIVSAIPVAPPVGYVEQPTLVERIRSMVRSEHLRYAATEAGYETFEDSEDFDTGEDDHEPHTPYESVFDPPVQSTATQPPVEPAPKPPAEPPAAPSPAPAPAPAPAAK